MNTLYELTVDDELVDGVYALSLVESPAIELDYILLSDENLVKVHIELDNFVKTEKRKVVLGAALVPDKVIARSGYDIVFSKDTVRKISENFIMNGNKDNVTLEHKISVNKVKLIESWIVEDPKNDKSSALGLDVPTGTWMVSLKILDDNLWSEWIDPANGGKLKGISLEGNFSQKEVKLEQEHVHDENCNHSHYEQFSQEELEILKLMDEIEFTPNNLDEFYVWRIEKDPSNPNAEICPACIKFKNQARTLRKWLTIAVPRVQDGTMIAGLSYVSPYGAGKYGTYCEAACRCRLIKVPRPNINAPKVTPQPQAQPKPRSIWDRIFR